MSFGDLEVACGLALCVLLHCGMCSGGHAVGIGLNSYENCLL